MVSDCENVAVLFWFGAVCDLFKKKKKKASSGIMTDRIADVLRSYLPNVVLTLTVLVSQIELAILKFPYESWGTPFQQLKQVVDEPSPQLPADGFSPEFVDFISKW